MGWTIFPTMETKLKHLQNFSTPVTFTNNFIFFCMQLLSKKENQWVKSQFDRSTPNEDTHLSFVLEKYFLFAASQLHWWGRCKEWQNFLFLILMDEYRRLIIWLKVPEHQSCSQCYKDWGADCWLQEGKARVRRTCLHQRYISGESQQLQVTGCAYLWKLFCVSTSMQS